MSEALMRARTALLLTRLPQDVEILDVGCATGQFAHMAQEFFVVTAYDPNPHYRQYWHNERRITFIHEQSKIVPRHAFMGVVFGDSLEHLDDPVGFLSDYGAQVLVITLPCMSMSDWRHSKHVKPEHRHYWTSEGFEGFLGHCGYRVILSTDVETRLGRENILSWVAERR